MLGLVLGSLGGEWAKLCELWCKKKTGVLSLEARVFGWLDVVVVLNGILYAEAPKKLSFREGVAKSSSLRSYPYVVSQSVADALMGTQHISLLTPNPSLKYLHGGREFSSYVLCQMH